MAKELTEFEAYKQLEGLFGGGLRQVDQIEEVDVIQTGSPSLDRAIGVGGWPRGRVIQLSGRESSGKTLLSLIAIANWQAQDPENCACFIDAEMTFSKSWAKRFNLDVDRLLYIKDNNAGPIFTGLLGQVKKNKITGKITKIDGLLDMVEKKQILSYKNPLTGKVSHLNTGKMGIIVLDSIANLNVPMEVEAAIGKQNMSPVPRFLSTELKKLTPGVARANVAFIAINQIRENLSGMSFGETTSTSGGRALKHAISLSVFVSPSGKSDDILVNSYGDRVGHLLRCSIMKNKLSSPGKKAQTVVKFMYGIDSAADEILTLATMFDIIKKPSSMSYDFSIVGGNSKVVGKEKAIDAVKENIEVLESLVRDFYLSGKDIDDKDLVPVDDEDGDEVINPFDSSSEEDEEVLG